MNRKLLKTRAGQAAMVTSLVGIMIGGGSSAAQAAEGGGEVTGGISPAGCSSTGGGTWCQGTGMRGVLKVCYSNYTHPNNYHSSTAIIGNAVDKGYANAGYFSYAEATNGVAFTCYTYWNNNA